MTRLPSHLKGKHLSSWQTWSLEEQTDWIEFVQARHAQIEFGVDRGPCPWTPAPIFEPAVLDGSIDSSQHDLTDHLTEYPCHCPLPADETLLDPDAWGVFPSRYRRGSHDEDV